MGCITPKLSGVAAVCHVRLERLVILFIEELKMKKKVAREKAQWEADFYNRPWAVIIDHLSGYATEPMNPNIPENEIFEICQPSPDRGNRGDLVLDR